VQLNRQRERIGTAMTTSPQVKMLFTAILIGVLTGAVVGLVGGLLGLPVAVRGAVTGVIVVVALGLLRRNRNKATP
jgi:hypothetical protein